MTADLAHATAPPAQPDPDWTECWPFPQSGGPAVSFVSTGPTGGRLRVAYYRRAGDDHLVGRAWFGPETEGPPGHAHGGSIAAVLDETLGAAAWAAGHPVVIASLKVDFRTMLPLGTDATFETWIESAEGRKVHTRGRLVSATGDVFAEGRALCIVLGDHHLEIFKAARAKRHARPHRSSSADGGTPGDGPGW
jgi:acyl-coenzyme A thioesterase PaaI-like protein